MSKITEETYGKAPRLVKMHFTLDKINNAVDSLNEFFNTHGAEGEFTEEEGVALTGQTNKMILTGLCSFELLVMRVRSNVKVFGLFPERVRETKNK